MKVKVKVKPQPKQQTLTDAGAPLPQKDAPTYEKNVKPRAGVDPNRRFDKTQLHESHHGQIVHRDYAAHFFRWGFAQNFIGKGNRVLDIGCGQDQPLLRILQGSINTVPEHYLGVDYNRIAQKRKSQWGTIIDQFNFIDDHKKLKQKELGYPYDVLTCFEVIEHMRKPDGKKLLLNARDLMADDGVFLLSTPVYNGKKMAANHIHEYEQAELHDLIRECGFIVEKPFGTFASWNDLKKVITEDERELMEELHEYYSWEVLSTFLAPKYPDSSRNICWKLRK